MYTYAKSADILAYRQNGIIWTSVSIEAHGPVTRVQVIYSFQIFHNYTDLFTDQTWLDLADRKVRLILQ